MVKMFILIVCLAAALTASGQTNQDWCCRYPLRTFGNAATVNLTPLFRWWSHDTAYDLANANSVSSNSRPLSAWHRITGNHVGDAGSSWVVEAEIYTNPGVHIKARIMLKNPPIAEEQLFYSLKSELAAAIQQMTNDQRLYQTETKAEQKAEARAKPVRNTRKARNQANQNAQMASQDQQTASAALNDRQELEQAVPLAQKRLKAIPSRNGKYVLDCFALKFGETKAGVPIYDLGVVDIDSP
jgi:hypothetical protein